MSKKTDRRLSRNTDRRRQAQAEAYVQENLRRCPICKTNPAEWTYDHVAVLEDRKVHCKCGSCGCVLSINYGDMRGVNGSAANEFLKGTASYDAMVRSVYGKKKGVTYVQILESGTCEAAEDTKGQEIPLEELKEMFW